MTLVFAFPDVCDALVASMRLTLGADVVFDGTPATLVGASGLAIGATREGDQSGFSTAPADLAGGVSEGLTVTCLAWSGSGDVEFQAHRDAVGAIVAAVAARIAADRSLGGVVDATEITGGSWTQEQTGEGALCTCEFRISLSRY